VRVSDVITTFAMAWVLPAIAFATPPERVVSLNLCTDQIAMLVAAPGQLYSVSDLAADPDSSAMADQAGQYVLNYGRAEEIYLMQPDLVIASRFSPQASIDMLKRLGLEVAVFDSADQLDEIGTRIEEMGEILGREEHARALADSYNSRLTALREAAPDQRPSAAVYHANGYTSGHQALAGQILSAAGFDNIADSAGIPYGGVLSLEELALRNPDAVITSRRYPGASRSEDILDHPVVNQLAGRENGQSLANQDWMCGTPYVLDAIERVAALRAGDQADTE